MARNLVSLEERFNRIFKVFIRFGTIQSTRIALLCWVIVILGSWIHDFHRPPDFYLSNRRNIPNVLFAKWCLGWTLAFLTPYMVLTYWVKSNRNLKVVCKHVLRLLVGAGVWFVVTFVLDWIEHLTGECEGSDFYSRKHECIREGLVWNGTDISGHSFLLAYCALIISEEIQVISFWTNENANKKISHERIRSNKKFHSELKQKYVSACYLCNVLYIICCLLMALWVTLLAFTSVYFHTVNSKVLGIILGLLAWLQTYQAYFLSKYFPGFATGFQLLI
jgi:hypothetical protein